jgi:folate-dependent phosphoribosylglycinamide formyltransferase PurN
MGLVVLSNEGIEHRYVVGAIADAFPDQLDAIIVCDKADRSFRQRLAAYRRRYSYRQLASRVLARAYRAFTRADSRRADAYRRVLFPGGDPGRLPRQDIVRRVPSHNGAEILALLDELRPDVIAVYGTAIIRPPVIRTARRAILNMHTGISPRYRGTDTVFWPLHNQEPEWVGVTIHQLDEGIDSGPIISIGRPEIEAGDDDASLFAKCVAVGAPLYVDAIRAALAGTLSGEAQQLEEGRNYLGVERTVGAELRVRRLLRKGLLRSRSVEAVTR